VKGPARNALDVAAARALAVMRIFGVLLQVLVIVFWHDWYLTPAHLAVPGLAAGWGVVFTVRCLRGHLDRVTAAGELLVTTALLLTASWSLPPAAGGPNWIWLRLGGASTAIGWCVPLGLWLGCTALLAATGVVGFLAAGLPTGQVAAGTASEVVGAALFTVAAVVLRRGAAEADGVLVRVGARQRAHSVAETRRAARREAERILHDTVLNTLAWLAWGAPGSSDELVRARCRDSVRACADTFGVGDDPEPPGTLATRLGEVVTQARRDGLDVETSNGREVDVPPEVAASVAATVAEALSNVRRHAGVSRAEVAVAPYRAGVCVTVSDRGRGFEPLTAPPDRLGVRYSIMDRMTDVGGSADVESAPGRGTAITIRWSPEPAVRASLAPATAVLERSYALDAATGVGVGALLWQAALGGLLAARPGDYRAPLVVAAAWVVSFAALAWCVVAAGVRLGPPRYARALTPRPEASPAPDEAGDFPRVGNQGSCGGLRVVLAGAAALGAQLTAGMLARGGAGAPQTWVILAGEAVVVFLQAVRRPREWLPVLLLTTGTALAVILSRSGIRPPVVSRVTTLLYAQVALMAAVGVMLRARRAAAGVTVRAARVEADLAAQRLAALEVRRDRRERLRHLAEGPLLLLADVGAGLLDPRDRAVARRGAASAAALRRSLTRQFTPSASLITAFEPAIANAERRGVSVVMQVAGCLDGLPEPTQDEVVRAVAAVLCTVVGGRALLTVLGCATEGSVALSYDASEADTPAPRTAGEPPVPSRWTDILEEVEDGRACLEISWGSARSHRAGA
jgi:hypothetical protein